jgi:hypothetical protein
MIGSGARAALLRTIPINQRPYGTESAASEANHDPSKPQAEPAAIMGTAESGNRWSTLVKES